MLLRLALFLTAAPPESESDDGGGIFCLLMQLRGECQSRQKHSRLIEVPEKGGDAALCSLLSPRTGAENVHQPTIWAQNATKARMLGSRKLLSIDTIKQMFSPVTLARHAHKQSHFQLLPSPQNIHYLLI